MLLWIRGEDVFLDKTCSHIRVHVATRDIYRHMYGNCFKLFGAIFRLLNSIFNTER